MPVLRTDWHVFQVVPTTEGTVCKVLTKRRGIAAMAPVTRGFDRVGRKNKMVFTCRPLFPGYVFASIAGPQWGMLRLVPYLHPQPISMDGVPYRLTETDVAFIRELQEHPIADEREPPAPHVFKAGELVRILQGPFAQWQATVDAVKGRKLQVSAKIFGRPTPVTVPKHWVEAA